MINAIQFLITISSCVAITLLTGESEKSKRVGCLVGLVGQPFWLWSTFEAGQWGMFLVSAWFTYRYIVGATPKRLSFIRQAAEFTHL
ncbi:MAG: hypothetical protein ACD_74C00157G0001 [uncultured bacterium]|nr:MAG: hypothetical protein ACD_74C00157G0001 [uncultured bacterium]